jgi:hypothetical protein
VWDVDNVQAIDSSEVTGVAREDCSPFATAVAAIMAS